MKNGQGAAGDSEGLSRRIAELEAELELERAAKRDLADRAARHDLLVSLLPDAVLVHREGKIVFANPVAAALHGAATPEELIGRDTLDLVHPDDHGLIFARRKRIPDGPVLDSLEYRRLRIDGSEFKAETRASEISWDGEAAILVVVRDLTRRIRARKALRDSEARYRKLAELSPDGIMVHTDGIVMYANPGLALILGAESPDDLIGKRSIDFVVPAQREKVLDLRKNLTAGEVVALAEATFVRLDGSETCVERVVSAITWQDRPSFLVIVRDVNDRHQAEQAQHDSEARYRQLAELSPDGILVTADDVIVYANPSVAGILGADSPDELIGLPALDVVAPAYHEELRARRKMMRKGESIGLVEGKYLRRDGSETHVERVSSKINWQGREAFLIIVRDNNDRKQAEQAQRESEARYRSLAELSPDGIMVHTDGVIVYANLGLAKILGAESPDELIGVHALDLVTLDQREQVMARRKKVGTGANAGLMEGKYLRRDGSETFVERISSQITWQGKPSYLVLVRDVNERKQAEEKLREREQYIEGMLNHIADAVVTIGETGQIETLNPSAERMFGYTEAEAVGRNVSFLMPQPYQDAHDGHLDGYLRTGKSTILNVGSREVMAQRKDGTVFPMELTVGEMAAGGGRAFIGAMRDITERTRAESELRNSEARFRDLIEGSDLGIQIGSRDKGRLFANQACAKLFGYDTADELRSVPRQGIVADYDRERVTGYREALFDSDTSVRTYEFDGLHKDGSIIPLQVFMRRIVWEGEDAIQRTFIDLTDRKKAEEQLHQAQKMEVVGQLTGGVAHDFNNLLTIILGNLELLDRMLEDDKMKEMARTAINASRRGAELTQRLLAFSRKQTLEPKLIDVNELLAGTTELMARSLGETIAIEVLGGDDLWMCEIDPVQLENAILNLAINARDAMPDGGALTFETANVSLDEAYAAAQQDDVSAGDYVLVSVADTGTGMSRDVIERAFDPFFTTKGVGEGSGLGLSMVYGFVKQSRGHVSIDSTPWEGTVVKLYLPKSAATPRPEQDAAEEGEPVSRGETILVVEDDPEVRALSVRMLADLGYEIVEAADGRNAVEVLKNTSSIDLLFTDVVLPGGMNGADIAMEAIRRMPGIKVLYVSGYADNVLASQGRLDAEVQFIGKPYRKGDLARKVRAVLDDMAA